MITRPSAVLGCALAGLTLALASTANAGNLEPAGINLGGTSFFDGFGASKPGWAYLGYYQYQRVRSIKGNDGQNVSAIRAPKIDTWLLLNQLAYTTSARFFHGQALLGFTGLLPILKFNSGDAPGSSIPLSSNDGIGDLTFGAYLQFLPIIRGGRPVYAQRVEFDLIAPTGRYSSSTNINPSANFWSINPYWAATWLPTPKTEITWHLSYLYNFRNTDTGLPQTSSDQAGQAAWVNFTASYSVKPNLNIGLNGYYFQQLTGDTYDSRIPNIAQLSGDTGKARVLAIGPGAYWRQDRKNMFAVNLYDQMDVRNRSQGTILNVHWIHAF